MKKKSLRAVSTLIFAVSVCLNLLLAADQIKTDEFYAFYTKIPAGNVAEVDEITGKYADIVVHLEENLQFIFCRAAGYLPCLQTADKKGITSGSIEHNLLKEWLERKPPNKLMEAWIHYMEGLCEKLTGEEKEAMKKEMLGSARAVAEASGGILGINKISREEKEALEKMEKVFC